MLEGHDLAVVAIEQASEAPKEEVIASEPPPGTRVPAGETVTLIVSTGEPDEEDDEPAEDEGPGRSDEAPGHDKDKDKEKEKDEE